MVRLAFLTSRVDGLKTKAAGKDGRRREKKLLNFKKETYDVQQELLKSRAATWEKLTKA